MSSSEVLSSASREGSWVSKNLKSLPVRVNMGESLPENEVYREIENNLMTCFEFLDLARA